MQLPFCTLRVHFLLCFSITLCVGLHAFKHESVKKFKPVVSQIIDDFTRTKYKGKVFENLALFVDTHGPRLAGTPALEKAIDYMKNLAEKAGLKTTENFVNVTLFDRKIEECTMSVPDRTKNIAITGLPYSTSTSKEGITAPVIVVSSFDEIDQLGDKLRGKIVVCRPQWTGYATYSAYRGSGPNRVAKYGALAYLVRSATPYSLYTLHTGMTAPGTTIPAAAITVEDADYIHRWSKRGANITITLKLVIEEEKKISRNLIVDYVGGERPNEYTIVSGHIDSWDLSDCANDDASGAMLAMEAILYLKKNNLQPRRTVRVVLWTAEEQGLVGAQQFAKDYKDIMPNVSLAMEADLGANFFPYGITFSGTNPVAKKSISRMVELLSPINANNVKFVSEGSDVDVLEQLYGVPISTLVANDYDKPEFEYFKYHHSPADTMTAFIPEQLDNCAAMWTALTYMVSNLDEILPR